MSSFSQGPVKIEFEADRRPIDNYLAELRKGVVVPVTFGSQPGQSGNSNLAPQQFMPGVPRVIQILREAAADGACSACAAARSRGT
jgi:hypothetical protein